MQDQPSNPADYVLDDQVGFLLRQVSQRHAALFQAHAPEGLTPTQFSVLIRLSDTGPCSQNRLGRLVAMDVATIKGVVDRLRRKGFVASAADPDDRRRTLISLTAQGAALIPTLQIAGHQITADTLAPLSPEERAAFLRLLRRLV